MHLQVREKREENRATLFSTNPSLSLTTKCTLAFYLELKQYQIVDGT